MKGMVFDIQRFSVNDGPGIRTTVFMKGCKLRCLWCHNPESFSPQPELIYYEMRCIGCMRCVEVCPQRTHQFVKGRHILKRGLCQRYKEYTGVNNDLILENARGLSSNGVKMEIRVPLIPGYNDSKDSIKAIGKFVDELTKKEKVKFVPYHHFAGSKYRQLGKTYPMEPIGMAEVEESLRRSFQILKGSGMEIIDG